ncbi:MAG: ArsR family transcriptional regulator [Anaerolineae bacterium]
MPVEEFLIEPGDTPLEIAVEPAHNAIYSLLLVAKNDEPWGLGAWVERTARALDAADAHRHRLVLLGFYHAIVPSRGWTSFPAYVDHLATCDPLVLRDRLLEAYARMPVQGEGTVGLLPAGKHVDRRVVLRDVDSYLEFLYQRFPAEHVDAELEAEAYAYAVDPPAMQDLIATHLRRMWDEHLAAEWTRVEPMLADSARAFREQDLGRMTRREAARWATDQDLEGTKWDTLFEQAGHIILVPSAHIGPYVGRMWSGDTYWLFFGARLPKGSPIHAPDLSRAELLVRLAALTDDTRLQILQRIAAEGELSSQEIMASLALSQSATSRHLKQLSATGYLSERRCNGAKCHTLAPERIEETLQALSSFLLGKGT